MVACALIFVAAALLAGATNRLELLPWRRATGAHWTERARVLQRARSARTLNLLFIPILLAASHWLFFAPASPAVGFFAGLGGALLGGFPMDRALFPELNFGRWSYLLVATLLLQFLQSAAFLSALAFMPDRLDGRAVALTAGFLAAQFAVLFGLNLQFLRWLRLLRPASPHLVGLVAEASARQGVPVRATWELDGPHANALAFVMTGDLAFTTKLLALAPDDEIAAICAHELGHLSESRWVRAGRAIGSLALMPFIFATPLLHCFGPGALMGLAVTWYLLLRLSRRLARSMEKRADRIATDQSAHDQVYARALERIYRINQMPVALRRSATRIHPDLYDRLLAAHYPPDYPRPAPPARWAWTSAIFFVALVGLAAVAIWRLD
jgi:Zn-dependent protease with chaperone function